MNKFNTEEKVFFEEMAMRYDEETEIACQRLEDMEYLLSLKGDIFTGEKYND
jgi:hypothetical protein